MTEQNFNPDSLVNEPVSPRAQSTERFADVLSAQNPVLLRRPLAGSGPPATPGSAQSPQVDCGLWPKAVAVRQQCHPGIKQHHQERIRTP